MNYNMLLYSFAVSNVIMISNTLNYVLLNWISWSFWKKKWIFWYKQYGWNPWRCSLLFTIVSRPFWRNPCFYSFIGSWLAAFFRPKAFSAQQPQLPGDGQRLKMWLGIFRVIVSQAYMRYMYVCMYKYIYIYFYINI